MGGGERCQAGELGSEGPSARGFWPPSPSQRPVVTAPGFTPVCILPPQQPQEAGPIAPPFYRKAVGRGMERGSVRTGILFFPTPTPMSLPTAALFCRLDKHEPLPLPKCPSSHSLIFETHRLIIDGCICGLALGALSQALGKGKNGGEAGSSNPRKGPQAAPSPDSCFWPPPLPTSLRLWI